MGMFGALLGMMEVNLDMRSIRIPRTSCTREKCMSSRSMDKEKSTQRTMFSWATFRTENATVEATLAGIMEIRT